MRYLKRILLAGVLAAAACGGASSVGGSGAELQTSVVSPRGDRLPAGTQFWATLDTRIGRDSSPGDRFSAHLSRPVLAPDGQVLLPEGTRLIGHVADVQEGHHGGQEAVIVLTFDELRADGMRQPIHASIVATDAATRGSSTSVDKEDVLIGAGLGAIIGGIAEGGEGLIVGGILGAGAGTAVSLGKNYDSGAGELDRGTGIEVRLERPVRHVAGHDRGGRFY